MSKPRGAVVVRSLVVALALVAISGCSGAKPSRFDVASFTLDDVNFYRSGKRINFVHNTIADVEKAFGRPGMEIHLTANELGEVRRASYESFSVDYYVRTGSLRMVEIFGRGVSVEGKVEIGTPKPDVERNLSGGIESPETNAYLFLSLKPGGQSGVGYDIHYDENLRVARVSIWNVPLGI